MNVNGSLREKKKSDEPQSPTLLLYKIKYFLLYL